MNLGNGKIKKGCKLHTGPQCKMLQMGAPGRLRVGGDIMAFG